MVDFKWKKKGNLTEKAKAYLSLIYKNQYSKGKYADKKDKAKKLVDKSSKRKKKGIIEQIKEGRKEGGEIIRKQESRLSIAYNFIPLNNKYYSAIIQVFLDNEDPRIEKKAEMILRRFIANYIGYNEWENWASRTLQIGKGWQRIPKTNLPDGYYEARIEDNDGKTKEKESNSIYR